MNFSTGQLTFALIFLVAFVLLMIFAYRKDARINRIHYKGAYKVLIAIGLVFAIVYALIRILH